MLNTSVLPLGTSSYLTHGVRTQFLSNLQSNQGSSLSLLLLNL